MHGQRLQIDGPPETTGASGTLSLVSVADFQAYIGQTADATFDALCQTILDSVSYEAFSYLGGRFVKRPATEFDFAITPESPEVLFLHQYPVGAVSAIELGEFTANGTWNAQVTVSALDWYADMRSGRLYPTNGVWPPGRHSVRVVWTGGFTAVPADIKVATMQWALVRLKRLRTNRIDATSSSGPTESATYESELPQAARVVFDRYKLTSASILG